MPRPKFRPTAEQRKTVEAMAAYGIPEAEIARTLGKRGIDPKTLRRYFREQLDLAAPRANATVAQTLFKMATSGTNTAATIFWMKSRAGWRETSVLQHSGPAGRPIEIVSRPDLSKLDSDELRQLESLASKVSGGCVVEMARSDEQGEEAGADSAEDDDSSEPVKEAA